MFIAAKHSSSLQKYNGFTNEFIMLEQDFVTTPLTAINQPLMKRWITFVMEDTT